MITLTLIFITQLIIYLFNCLHLTVKPPRPPCTPEFREKLFNYVFDIYVPKLNYSWIFVFLSKNGIVPLIFPFHSTPRWGREEKLLS